MENKRTFAEIGREILGKWRGISAYARLYVLAMLCIDSCDKNAKFGLDDAESVALYFLSNAGGWRGKDARRIKKEIKDMLK